MYTNKNFRNIAKYFKICLRNLDFVLSYAPLHKFCACLSKKRLYKNDDNLPANPTQLLFIHVQDRNV